MPIMQQWQVGPVPEYLYSNSTNHPNDLHPQQQHAYGQQDMARREQQQGMDFRAYGPPQSQQQQQQQQQQHHAQSGQPAMTHAPSQAPPPQQQTPTPAPAPAPRSRKRAAPSASHTQQAHHAPPVAQHAPVQQHAQAHGQHASVQHGQVPHGSVHHAPVQQHPAIATPQTQAQQQPQTIASGPSSKTAPVPPVQQSPVPAPAPSVPQSTSTAPPPANSTPTDDATASGNPPPAKKSRTNTPWTPAEEQRLKQMRDAGNSWSEIAKTFPSRTEGSVKKHWYKDMHYAEFAEDESQNLMNAIKEYETNKWKVIGQKVGKPAKACEQYAKEHFPELFAVPNKR